MGPSVKALKFAKLAISPLALFYLDLFDMLTDVWFDPHPPPPTKGWL